MLRECWTRHLRAAWPIQRQHSPQNLKPFQIGFVWNNITKFMGREGFRQVFKVVKNVYFSRVIASLVSKVFGRTSGALSIMYIAVYRCVYSAGRLVVAEPIQRNIRISSSDNKQGHTSLGIFSNVKNLNRSKTLRLRWTCRLTLKTNYKIKSAKTTCK